MANGWLPVKPCSSHYWEPCTGGRVFTLQDLDGGVLWLAAALSTPSLWFCVCGTSIFNCLPRAPSTEAHWAALRDSQQDPLILLPLGPALLDTAPAGSPSAQAFPERSYFRGQEKGRPTFAQTWGKGLRNQVFRLPLRWGSLSWPQKQGAPVVEIWQIIPWMGTPGRFLSARPLSVTILTLRVPP